MVVRSDGRVVRRLAVSLGAAATPTYRGVKVVEEFDHVEDMEGTPVYWSVRITTSGEFVHAAPWNSKIGARQPLPRLHQPVHGRRALVLSVLPPR